MPPSTSTLPPNKIGSVSAGWDPTCKLLHELTREVEISPNFANASVLAVSFPCKNLNLIADPAIPPAISKLPRICESAPPVSESIPRYKLVSFVYLSNDLVTGRDKFDID